MIPFAEAQAHDLTIQGLIFPVRVIYDAGHELNAHEAEAIQQTREENLRNNFASKVRTECEAEKVKESKDLSAETKAKLVAAFPDFEEAYEFGARGGAREVDPVKKQAMLFAITSVKTALTKANYRLSDVGTDKIKARAEKAVAEDPRFMSAAQEVVDARTRVAQGLELVEVAPKK